LRLPASSGSAAHELLLGMLDRIDALTTLF
jgi:hypothetical protein